MKRIYCLLIALIISGVTYSQNTEECGTIPRDLEERKKLKYYGNNKELLKTLDKYGYDVPDDYFDNLDSKGKYKGRKIDRKKIKSKLKEKGISGRVEAVTGNIYVPLAIHIYRDDNNNMAATWQEVWDAFNTHVVTAFADNETSIVPYIKSIGVSPNNQHFDVANVVESGIMYLGSEDPNAVNVHVVNTSYVPGAADGNGKYMHLRQFDGLDDTWAHELGHIFGLEHTFLSTGSGEYNMDNGNCDQESVNRNRLNAFTCGVSWGKKKCETNGDGLCDTPASPEPMGNCNNPVEGTDNWGDAWEPILTNYMDGTSCRSTFTLGQIAVMLDEAESKSFSLTSTSNTISGSGMLCKNSNVTFTSNYSDPNYSEEWTVTGDLSIVSGQGTPTVTINTGNNGGELNVSVYGAPVLGKEIITYDSSTPVSITGDATAAPDNQNRGYVCTPYTGASYYWYVPYGWSISSGQNTNTIYAKPGYSAVSGYIEVSMTICNINFYRYLYVDVSSGGGGGPGEDLIVSNEMVGLYPNPSYDKLTVDGLPGIDKSYNYSIIEVASGRVVRARKEENYIREIDISQLNSGNYLLVLFYDDKEYKLKFVKR